MALTSDISTSIGTSSPPLGQTGCGGSFIMSLESGGYLEWHAFHEQP